MTVRRRDIRQVDTLERVIFLFVIRIVLRRKPPIRDIVFGFLIFILTSANCSDWAFLSGMLGHGALLLL